MTTERRGPETGRYVSLTGLLAMVVGLGMVGVELSTGFVRARLGATGHIVILTCGIFFSIWGLKELIAGVWPRLGQSGIGRHRFLLPSEGWVYLVIMFVVFVGSMLGRSNPLMLVFCMMAGPFIVNGWLTFTLLKKLNIERRAPPRVMAGEPASVEITLSNGKPWLSSWLMSIVDRASNDRETLYPGVLFARIPPRDARTGHYHLELVQRGVYELGPLQINTRFPLGLVERGLNVDLRDKILVYPRLGRLTPDWQLRLQQQSQHAQQKHPRGGSLDDEFHKIRDYRPGDDLRAVHWKTSARQSELMVREFQQSRDQDLVILLDAWLPAKPLSADLLAVERAISLAASVAADQCQRGRDAFPYFAAAGKAEMEWGGASGSHRLDTLLDALATLEPAATSNLPSLLNQGNDHLTPRHKLLLVSSRPGELFDAVSSWAAEQPVERSRALRLLDILSSRDPQIDQWIHWSV
ncbi:MAG: DUF58 domain-containing protein [Planctomycetaceae bacterium]